MPVLLSGMTKLPLIKLNFPLLPGAPGTGIFSTPMFFKIPISNMCILVNVSDCAKRIEKKLKLSVGHKYDQSEITAM